jgi:hypothetical protein
LLIVAVEERVTENGYSGDARKRTVMVEDHWTVAVSERSSPVRTIEWQRQPKML